jgi:hypothetical protein
MEKLVELLFSVMVIVCLDYQNCISFSQFLPDDHFLKRMLPMDGDTPFLKEHLDLPGAFQLFDTGCLKKRPVISSDGSHQRPLVWFAG